jgi:hypothetical protein
MSEFPILFTGPMVRAILAGTKTQTRRVVTCQNSTVLGHRSKALWAKLNWSKPARVDRGPHMMHDEASSYLHVETTEETVYRVRCRRSIGDRFWVKETHWVDGDDQPVVFYAATDNVDKDQRLRPSIFMERRMSRLLLEITDIRVQRIQSITGEDIKAEGVDVYLSCEPGRYAPRQKWDTRFQELWDSINADRGLGWKVNPWVWVYTFRRVEA